MNQVLILYPLEFKSQSKFDRKVEKITKNIKEYSIIFPNDNNGLIKNFLSSRAGNLELVESFDWKKLNITHAIIFDDGEEFAQEIDYISSVKIPLRVIPIKITRVVNIKKETKYTSLKSTAEYEYIGRGSYWGNPYSMFAEGDSRDEVIRKFKYDFEFEKFAKKEKSEVYKLVGKRLGCFCKPDACHGDVLAEFLNQWDDGE